MSAGRRWKAATLVVLLLGLLVAGLWFLGHRMGLATTERRLVAILALLLLAVTVVLLASLRRPRPARPAPEPEPTHLKEEVLGALQTLKSSHLGRTRGSAARYDLPWVLVLGRSGAGKTMAIRTSGLDFPLPQASRIGGGQPASTFDWNFSTEGILLDVPGRFLEPGRSDEDGEGRRRSEWGEYLRLLGNHRPDGPLEGILVAVELEHLLRPDPALAQRLRQRISEVEHAFGMKVPVYLLITKLDLLPGFASFFEDLEERAQAWGAALPHDQGPGFEPGREVEHHCALLHQGLCRLAGERLARPGGARPALTTFPREFRLLGQALAAFTRQLVGRDPYHARPFIRGFYFSSSLQGEAPLRAATGELAAAYGLTTPAVPATGAGPCFLEPLFRRIIFADRFLASHLGTPRQRRAKVAWMGAGLALLALGSGLWAWSFAGNRKLVAQAREELTAAASLWTEPALEARMRALLLLQLRLEELARHRQEGRPRSLGWGLYQGHRLERELRGRYFAGVSELMLAPVKKNLEATLERAALRPAAPPRPPRRRRPAQPRRAPVNPILRVAHRKAVRRVPTSAPTPAPTPAPPLTPDGQVLQIYNALKTYLMLQNRARMEAEHLRDQLPLHWRPHLEAAGARRGEVLPMAQRMVAFYLANLAQPDLPVIENDEKLVSETRRHLRARIRNLSPLEQIYQELKAVAETRFEPMTVARILKDRDLDLVASGHHVPGSFTREAYEGHFRSAFKDPAAFHRPDWVLASAPEGPFAEGGEALEALYRAEYQQAWDTFLGSLMVMGFVDPIGASAALGRLGDPQASPLKLILARAAYETAWDNPSELEKGLQNAKTKVLNRTEKLLGPRAPGLPSDKYGPLGGHFSALASLATPAEGGAAALDGYLQLLQKARTRLGTLALAGDPCASAREYLQATLLGASELAEAQLFLETALLGRVDGHGRDLLQPLLLRPLVLAYAALIPPAEQDINRAWTRQVWGRWSALAGMYPFSDSALEAPLADLHAFLKPGEGVLPTFMTTYLGQLVAVQGDRLVPRLWAGRGPAFRDDFLAGVSRLCNAATVLREAAVSRFELQPVPTPGLKEILLEIDGQRLHYRNGPQAWTPFSWPGPASYQGARLQGVTLEGAAVPVQNAPGRLGLLRILEQARTFEPGGSMHTLEWPIGALPRPVKDSERPGSALVRFNYRLVGGPDPLRLSALRHHSLPPKATH